MDITAALILGLVQGITEFLPISSSGHLVLVREFLELDAANALAIDAVLHLATTAAISLYFWNDIWVLIQTAIRKLGRLPVNEKDLTLLYALLIGTLPAVIVGLLLESVVEKYFTSALLVVAVLFIAAVFFMYAEWRYYTNPPQGPLTVRRGLLVGCFQILALLPGFSRSGATLAGGMLLGMSRIEAARFSFLLAIPITLGVGTKKLLELISLGGSVSWFPVALGATVSFLAALIVIHFFLGFIRRYSLWPFIWYSIVLSLLVGYVTLYV
jgi:undecaprenyl-diphosphatase